MNFSRIFSATAIIITLTATTAFAANNTSVTNRISLNNTSIKCNQYVKSDCVEKQTEFEKDPIKSLEERKAKIQSLFKEDKISKEKAAEKITKIDSKITEIQSFDKLSLQDKKDKLIKDSKAYVEKLIAEGKLDRIKADSILKKYAEKISSWNGTGYPQLHLKHAKCKRAENETSKK